MFVKTPNKTRNTATIINVATEIFAPSELVCENSDFVLIDDSFKIIRTRNTGDERFELVHPDDNNPNQLNMIGTASTINNVAKLVVATFCCSFEAFVID